MAVAALLQLAVVADGTKGGSYMLRSIPVCVYVDA